jgi:hypothetical protein
VAAGTTAIREGGRSELAFEAGGESLSLDPRIS